MKIVFFGNGPRGARCLEHILHEGFQVVGAVGHPGEEKEFHKAARSKTIPLIQPENPNSRESLRTIGSFQADVFVLSGYNKIFRRDLIRLPRKACINLHGGKLPEYRGTAPINWQIIRGETKGGCAILHVDEGIDTGDIIAQAEYFIGENETSADIISKQLELFPPMLVRALRDIEAGTLTSFAQDETQACHYVRRFPRDSQINWSLMTAWEVHNLVRAMVDPYPNAFSWLDGQKVSIQKTALIDPPVVGPVGRIALRKEGGIVVCCRDRGILVLEGKIEFLEGPVDLISKAKLGQDFSGPGSSFVLG